MKDLNLETTFKNLYDNSHLYLEVERATSKEALKNCHVSNTSSGDHLSEPFHVGLGVLIFDVVCAKRGITTMKNGFDAVEIYYNLTKPNCKPSNPAWGNPAFHFQNRNARGQALFQTSITSDFWKKPKKKPSPKRVTIQSQLLDIISKKDDLTSEELSKQVKTKHPRTINTSLLALKKKGLIVSTRHQKRVGNYTITYCRYRRANPHETT